ncbi:MAG: hypothetical protein A2X77_04620 [Gammaproteobacteria bacterium GWE2_42_36]|nr:MAG: hypothetical protein A2X77_04620 [Gammaproteobacteria bacterium GWE2_42_36]
MDKNLKTIPIQQAQKMRKPRSCWKWVMITLIILFAVYLLFEHKAHIMSRFFDILFVGLILLCPLMHLFMHHGHKHRDHDKH